MAYIDNSDTKKEINDAIRGNAVSNLAPTQLANQVIPVIDVNPKALRRSNIARTASTSGASTTIYTTPADKDFFLVGANFSFIKDATSDIATNAALQLRCIIDGLTTAILNHAVITLTAQSGNISISFPFPLKIDRNTAISLFRASTTAGVTVIAGSIVGYTVEP